jgi:hypothetical protein
MNHPSGDSAAAYFLRFIVNKLFPQRLGVALFPQATFMALLLWPRTYYSLGILTEGFMENIGD